MATPVWRPWATTWPFISPISVGRPLATSWAIEARQLRAVAVAGVSIRSSASQVSRRSASAQRSAGAPPNAGTRCPSASPTRADSAASRIISVRPTSLEAISREPSPESAWSGLLMAFCESLAQRSPQRLSVARAPSITESISASAWTRGVIRPSCSPTRNTSCPAPCPFSKPRSTRPGFQRATPIFDMTSPTARVAPATPATIGSGQQFCAETTAPAGAAWRSASWVAQAVS